MGYWLLIALLAPTLWAVTNHIDKYLLNQQLDQRGIGALLTASALIGLPCMLAIVLLRPGVLHISLFHSLMMVANGVLYIVGLLPYLYALQRDETSIIVPLFQTTAIFSYLLGLIFLDEQLSIRQLAAVLLLVGGAVIISLERKWQLVQFKADVFWLMLLAALLNALNWFVFKYVAIQDDFWATSFWEYAGFLLTALFILLAVPPYRRDFVVAMRHGGRQMIGLSALNELIGIGAKTATNIASLLAPLALVSSINGLQPLFTFIYGIVLTYYLPRYGSERLSRGIVMQKTTALVLIIAGTTLLSV
ncbi:MAG: EamA family transporter [Chloroflexi bacterium SZAS-1]|jgi:drug/metabolite transporter (DMT)-like permease|nr:EamA family transporter [Chloroflexi bacterium SZAS-1]HNP88293.1 EamA family transporter [Kouleothrix sp.]